MIRKLLLFGMLLACTSTLKAQLVFDTISEVETMVRNAFLSDGITLSNIRYTGSAKAIQVFTNDNNSMPVKAGLFLGTGSYRNAKGPNYDNGMSFSLNTRGDAQLTQLAGNGTLDAAILEFDFVSTGDSVSFRYVFASEEYPEYVGSKFNDVFAFFISGPGIKGIKNLAVLPRSRTPITVNNVNDKKNKAYYVDNAYRVYDPFNRVVDTMDVQFDGFTRLLEARCAVIPGEVYHLRICIADVRDAIYDSGVFLESGSFKSSGTLSSGKAPTTPVRNKSKQPAQLMSPRYLGIIPEPFAARIVFDSAVVCHADTVHLTAERLEKILILLNNYARADYVIQLGYSDTTKEKFAEYLQQRLIEKGVVLHQLSVVRLQTESKKKNKRTITPALPYQVELLIKQKSRLSEE